ncbi:cytochrome b [Sinirhodobacter populi]|uniref:Cytochrome b n=1 Tax=Paenirhodobacter populi TaxID=2306993 RepID=A0A443KH05_9RHOB|nr:cytochrome b N-terminal domain-containing protein [Sinirhodobacter populi]RWR32016.1 cytochrome b [Sinirhodobacter populi]
MPYAPRTRFGKWLHRRLPVMALIHDTLSIPTPRNLNWWWIWGMVLVFCLVMQIATGVVLAMHYTPQIGLAFASVEHIMRDVNGGAVLRYVHQNGASLFFLAVYVHIFRSLYYGSFKAPRELTWVIGMMLYLAMMAVAFTGYVLPWGQMSYWAATVITNIFGAIPGIGPALQEWVLGGPSVGNAALNRFFVLHFLIPFIMVALVALHVWGFHTTGNSNPAGVEPRRDPEGRRRDTLPFWPYFAIKDLAALSLVLVIFAAVTAFMPNYLGHPDNYIEANPLVTPEHIVPEWYFLPFYAILRAFTADVWVVIAADRLTFGVIDAQRFGVLAMFGSLLVLILVPWLDRSAVRSGAQRPLFRVGFWLLVLDFAVLTWVGARPAAFPYDGIALAATGYWFVWFLVILPLLPRFEKPRPAPATIEEAGK